jgi:hypothetical protein
VPSVPCCLQLSARTFQVQTALYCKDLIKPHLT